ncbi:hypothetical protein MBLNU457_g2624t1 [Dothideomycetes sp. NU457]
MPCTIPGHIHRWPNKGVLVVEKCERICGYCKGPGAKNEWKFPWFLRRHVKAVHTKKHTGDKPNVTVSDGWSERPNGIPKGRNGLKSRRPSTRVLQKDDESEYDSDEETANGPGTASAHGDTNADTIEAETVAAAAYSTKVRAAVNPAAAASRKAPAPVKKTSVTARKAPVASKKNTKTIKGRKNVSVVKSTRSHRMSTRSRNKSANKRAPVESDGSDESDDYEDVEDGDEDSEAEDVDMLDAAAGASNDSAAPIANMTGGLPDAAPTLKHKAAPAADGSDNGTFTLATDEGPVILTHPELMAHFQTAVHDMTAQGLDCGIRPMDIISALHSEINRLYGTILPTAGFHPQHPALMPQAFQPPFEEPLVAQVRQPPQQHDHLTVPIGHAHPINPNQHAFDAISPIAQSIEAFAMTGIIEEAPQHGLMTEYFNPIEQAPVDGAIKRLEAIENAQLNSPKSPSI